MSAALQLTAVWGVAEVEAGWSQCAQEVQRKPVVSHGGRVSKSAPAEEPDANLAFYRKHTERMLRRYLYASMQVGRAPSVLSDSVGRGWVSSRPVRTFEDAIIFVLDVEACLNRLSVLDRQMLSRIVLQEYTQTETASLLGMGVRTLSYKFPRALDRLTQLLLDSGLLVLPR
jgi:hypothetical protein